MSKIFFEVLRPGINTTFQDKGRFHMQHFGITPGGCMDIESFLIANALVGNSSNEGVIEFAYQGPLLKFYGDKVNIVITGDVVFKIRQNDKEIDGNCYETVFQYTSLAINEFGIPTDFSVYQNYPNPFNPSTTIEFDVATPTNISLVVYDLAGKEVYSLASGYHVPGRYSVIWNAIDSNGESVSSGMYIYQLRTSGVVLTKKLVLLR